MNNLAIGDKVQLLNTAKDVTNGLSVRPNGMFTQGGSMWATVDNIVPNWRTGGKFGLPSEMTKVVLKNDQGIVIYQVDLQSIASNVIRSSNMSLANVYNGINIPVIPNIPSLNVISTTVQNVLNSLFGIKDTIIPNNVGGNARPYTTEKKAESWTEGVPTTPITSSAISSNSQSDSISNIIRNIGLQTGNTSKVITGSKMDKNNPVTYENKTGGLRNLTAEEQTSIGTNNIQIDDSISKATFKTVWEDEDKRKELLNDDQTNIQNNEGFPYKLANASGVISAKYDYQIHVGDSRYPLMTRLEDKLMEARATFGLPVHGQTNIARQMKYYLYNRFKSPDINLAANRIITYVFFTRPDLNLLFHSGGALEQVNSHTESAMLWRRNPELFKLLTDSTRCEDSDNNFNLLLSNQVMNFELTDETLKIKEAGKSWEGYEMTYGHTYDGRSSGEFSCAFMDTSDLSIYHYIKLWMTYIHNVSRGEWKPSYNLARKNTNDPLVSTGDVLPPGIQGPADSKPRINSSHVYTRTLDYGASANVIICGPDGEDILFWSRYYGIFPVSTSSSSLSWNLRDGVKFPDSLSIKFRYSYKLDLSPISLLEFNSNANIQNLDGSGALYENSYNVNYNHSARPFVGAPFIEMKFQEPISTNGMFRTNSSIRLKFKPNTRSALTDRILYKNNLGNIDTVASNTLINNAISMTNQYLQGGAVV